MCPHSLIKNQLEQHLNQNRNLALLGKILHETYGAIKALARLPSTPGKKIFFRMKIYIFKFDESFLQKNKSIIIIHF